MTTDTKHKLLTQKQERFCIEYFLTGNQTQSAITAGYAPKNAVVTASKNLVLPIIKDRIQQLRKREEDMALEPVKERVANVIERKGKLTTIYRKDLPEQVSARDQVLAIAEHNKMDGDYAPEKRQVDLTVDVQFKVGKGYLTREQSPIIEVKEAKGLTDGNRDKA